MSAATSAATMSVSIKRLIFISHTQRSKQRCAAAVVEVQSEPYAVTKDDTAQLHREKKGKNTFATDSGHGVKDWRDARRHSLHHEKETASPRCF